MCLFTPVSEVIGTNSSPSGLSTVFCRYPVHVGLSFHMRQKLALSFRNSSWPHSPPFAWVGHEALAFLSQSLLLSLMVHLKTLRWICIDTMR